MEYIILAELFPTYPMHSIKIKNCQGNICKFENVLSKMSNQQ